MEPPSGGQAAPEHRPSPHSPAPPRRGPSRRALLVGGLAGTAGAAAVPVSELARDPAGGLSRAMAGPSGRPRPRFWRAAREYSFNSGWLFGEYTPGAEQPGHDDTGFTRVTLPHCVTPLSWENWEPARWERVWVYRRHFDSSGLADARVLVDFDGVMVNASVLVNGRFAGGHHGGYLPWSVELTSFLRPGDNVLAVVVDSRCLAVPPVGLAGMPDCVDFMQPGGIYRDVRLRVLPEAFLADVFAQPAEVLSDSPRVDIACTIDAAAMPGTPAQLTATLSDEQGWIGQVSRPVPLNRTGKSTASIRLTGFGRIELWSPENPKLYHLETTLSAPDIGTHTVRKRIGFRQAEFRADGFFLNGQRVKIFGLDRHQLFPYTGMAMPARVQRRDAEIIRNEFNCNMVRCSHYPQSPHFLDACDELGLMVWEEAPGWHRIGDAAWQDIVLQNVRDMVVRDRSRPSVIIWGTRLNEARGGHEGLWRRTRQIARDLDGSRPSSGAMNHHSEYQWSEDVFAFNDYRTEPSGDAFLLPPLGGVPYLITESVGVYHDRPGHYRWTDPPRLLTRQALLHAQVHDISMSDPRYAGLLAWSAFDYASPQGPGGQRVKWAGVADGFRVAKPGAAIYLSQVDPQTRPVIAPAFFWDADGATSPEPGRYSMIATNCEQLEILIGDEHAGAGEPVLDAQLYGHLAYPPTLVDLTAHRNDGRDELVIKGYIGGQQVAVLRMSSNPAGDRLAMTADDAEIFADGSDATRVVFRAVDAYGNQRRFRSGEVRLALDGPAELIGDNPFPLGEYGGLGAVWVRSRPGEPGPVTVTAEHPELGRARVQIEARPPRHSRLV